MNEKTDDLKGRAKEAAGDLTDDGHLKREGQVDRAGARIKEIFEEARAKVDGRMGRVVTKVTHNSSWRLERRRFTATTGRTASWAGRDATVRGRPG
ncbi:MAG: CsbD family protein [Actinomycetota bacterium]|nr:CsbD family protein [Actinomycetota bacterium]